VRDPQYLHIAQYAVESKNVQDEIMIALWKVKGKGRRDAIGHSMHIEVQVGLHDTPDMWRPSRMETTGS